MPVTAVAGTGPWRGGRVVYGSGLENQRVFTGTVGSNPTLSVV